mmetsp:Transcript_32596/g.50583  ORF Transcript_32596/g.50583 Transcript_32596/m.50583 type:complete len:313 (+) Transcript_32596:833-1771(+)
MTTFWPVVVIVIVVFSIPSSLIFGLGHASQHFVDVSLFLPCCLAKASGGDNPVTWDVVATVPIKVGGFYDRFLIGRGQHGFLIDGKLKVDGRSPNPRSAVSIGALPELDTPMAIMNFARLQLVIKMPIDVGSEAIKGSSNTVYLIRSEPSNVFLVKWLVTFHLLEDLPPNRFCSSLLRLFTILVVSPSGHNVKPSMRFRIPIVVETLSPKSVKRLRIFPHPVWLTHVAVFQIPFPIGGDVGDITVDGESAIGTPPGASDKEQDVGLGQCIRGLGALRVKVGLQFDRFVGGGGDDVVEHLVRVCVCERYPLYT